MTKTIIFSNILNYITQIPNIINYFIISLIIIAFILSLLIIDDKKN